MKAFKEWLNKHFRPACLSQQSKAKMYITWREALKWYQLIAGECEKDCVTDGDFRTLYFHGCGEYHPSISMCPPHEIRMKWGKNICPECGAKEKS